MMQNKYELIVGLEIHVQLATQSKLFCSDLALFGSEPNVNISPISLAHPGTLPMLNKKAVEYAVKMGLACGCEINPQSIFARKHYNYPDLPKGYQLTQHTQPICLNGKVPIINEGKEINIELHHIHLEEDAGKNIHENDGPYSYVDFNRAGVPLIEIVSLPCIKNSTDAVLYVNAIQKIVRYLEIGDADMEKGNLRCDVNISVRLKETNKLNTKVELKNLNSLRNIKKAIEVEYERQVNCYEKGEIVIQQTRSFDVEKNITIPLREKENSDDYRYFDDPDLAPIYISNDYLLEIKKTLPELPFEKEKRFVKDFQLTPLQAKILCEEKNIANYFEQLVQFTTAYKNASNWIVGPVKQYLNLHSIGIEEFVMTPQNLAKIIQLTLDETINYTDASSILFPEVIKNPQKAVEKLASDLGLMQQKLNGVPKELSETIELILNQHPNKVKEYKFDGKKGLIGFFVGEVVKNLNQKIDPKIIHQELKKALD